MTPTRRTILTTLIGLAAAAGCQGINRPTLFSRNRGEHCESGPVLDMPLSSGPMMADPGTYPQAPVYPQAPPMTGQPGQGVPPANPSFQPPVGPMPRPAPGPQATPEPYRPMQGKGSR